MHVLLMASSDNCTRAICTHVRSVATPDGGGCAVGVIAWRVSPSMYQQRNHFVARETVNRQRIRSLPDRGLIELALYSVEDHAFFLATSRRCAINLIIRLMPVFAYILKLCSCAISGQLNQTKLRHSQLTTWNKHQLHRYERYHATLKQV